VSYFRGYELIREASVFRLTGSMNLVALTKYIQYIAVKLQAQHILRLMFNAILVPELDAVTAM
jgi:hypothetical protein